MKFKAYYNEFIFISFGVPIGMGGFLSRDCFVLFALCWGNRGSLYYRIVPGSDAMEWLVWKTALFWQTNIARRKDRPIDFIRIYCAKSRNPVLYVLERRSVKSF